LEIPHHPLKTIFLCPPFASAKNNVLKGTNDRGALNTLDIVTTAPQKHPLPPKWRLTSKDRPANNALIFQNLMFFRQNFFHDLGPVI